MKYVYFKRQSAKKKQNDHLLQSGAQVQEKKLLVRAARHSATTGSLHEATNGLQTDLKTSES